MATAAFPAMQSVSDSMGLFVELIWNHAVNNLSATQNELLLPVDILFTIGAENLETIKTRFSNLLNTPVVGFQDNANNAYRIMPTTAFGRSVQTGLAQLFPATTGPAHNSATTDASPSDNSNHQTKTEKVPRPPNAFILYRKHHHTLIKAAHPEYHNNDISKIIGAKWNAEKKETKEHFKKLAEDIKVKHAAKYPNYQYAPRKPSEKKRRFSARRDKISAARKTSGQQENSTTLKVSIDDTILSTTNQAGETEQSPSETNMGTPKKSNSYPIVPAPMTQECVDMLQHHAENFMHGTGEDEFLIFNGDRNFPLVAASAPMAAFTAPAPAPAPAPPSNNTAPGNSGTTFTWANANVDIDFEDYFL